MRCDRFQDCLPWIQLDLNIDNRTDSFLTLLGKHEFKNLEANGKTAYLIWTIVNKILKIVFMNELIKINRFRLHFFNLETILEEG